MLPEQNGSLTLALVLVLHTATLLQNHTTKSPATIYIQTTLSTPLEATSFLLNQPNSTLTTTMNSNVLNQCGVKNSLGFIFVLVVDSLSASKEGLVKMQDAMKQHSS